MTLLYPSFLWLLLPLGILFWDSSRKIAVRTHLIILMLIVVALSRPVSEQALQDAGIEAKDIIIALDVSYSMQARDSKGSSTNLTRYNFAKKTIASLLSQNPSDNVMLIAFTTNPLLLSPPTTDHTLINRALDSLNPEFILTKGTSLETLFKKIAAMKMGHKSVILITDGGEEDNLAKLATLVQKADVSLTILALGTTQGTTLTKSDGTLLKDEEGNLVISRSNPLLKSLSTQVSAAYLNPAGTPQETAKKLDDILQNDVNKKQLIQKMQRHYLELYSISLVLALILFFMLHTRAIKYLLILFTLFGMQVEASMLDTYRLNLAYQSYKKADFNTTQTQLKQIEIPSLQSQMALANTYYKQGSFQKAIQTYKSIHSTSLQIKQQLYYNIANSYAMMELYDKAKIYYTKALQLGEDADAKNNLKHIALLSDKKSEDLGIAHPDSQDSSSSKSEEQDEEEDEQKSEDQPSSGSGGGGESKSKKEQEKNKLLSNENEEQHPLGSKTYELINKGYIHEKQPW